MKFINIISALLIGVISLTSCSKDTNTGSVRVNQEVQLYNFATSSNTLYIGVKQDTILKKCCAFYGDFIYYTDSINLSKRDTINKNLQLIDGVGNNLTGASATVPMDEMNNYLLFALSNPVSSASPFMIKHMPINTNLAVGGKSKLQFANFISEYDTLNFYWNHVLKAQVSFASISNAIEITPTLKDTLQVFKGTGSAAQLIAESNGKLITKQNNYILIAHYTIQNPTIGNLAQQQIKWISQIK
jgi:hypothetical protein